MLKINKVVIISFLIFTQLPLWAQNNTNSPYTRFGYGELADRSFGAGRAMGGVGYGLRSSKQINPLNPASYSCMDSLTFLFDFGASKISSPQHLFPMPLLQEFDLAHRHFICDTLLNLCLTQLFDILSALDSAPDLHVCAHLKACRKTRVSSPADTRNVI